MNDFAGLQRPTGIQWTAPHVGMVQYGDDNRLVIFFFIKSVLNAVQSKVAGMPIHENQIYIKIHEPGERLSVVERPATDQDKHRFANQWSKFIAKADQVPEGTPVDLLFPNNPAVADNLRAHGIYTIQQLAKLSANAIDTVGMGAQEWVNMANKYLSNANDGVAFHVMQSEMDKLKQDNKLKDAQILELQRQFNALYAKFVAPDKNSINPPWQPGHDAQAERIDTNHPSAEAAKRA